MTDTPYEVMPVSDMMISDFSSITFEYSLLRRPIILFECSDGDGAISDRNQYDMLRKCCFILDERDTITAAAFRIPDLDREKLQAMEELQRKTFANPGRATDVAIRKLIEHEVIIEKPDEAVKGEPAGA